MSGPAPTPTPDESPLDDARSSKIMQAVQDVGAAAAARRSPRAINSSAGPSGMSLAVKFALVISGVSAFLILTTGIVNYVQTRSALDSEIDTRGKDVVMTVGEIAQNYKAEVEQARLKRMREANLQPPLDPQAEGYREFLRLFKDDEKKIQTRYNELLLGLVVLEIGGEKKRNATILNAFVTKGPSNAVLVFANKPEILSGDQEELFYKSADGQPYKLPKGQRLLKQEGTLDGVPARAFLRELGDGEEGMTAYVVLSTEQIETTKNRLLLITLILTLIAILIGILISFLLSSRVTKPVRRLVDDIAIVSSGNLEHRTIAMSNDEIGMLAASFDAMTENLKMAHEQELEHKAREHELNIATEIQSNLLPKKIPQYEGFDIGAFWQPSKEVGGDYYDFIPIDDEHVGIVVADVSGKGVPGSLVMTMARILLRMEAQRNMSAADTFIKTNRVIAKDIKRGMFVTAMYCILNIKTGVIQVASAGHNPMVIYRAQMSKVSLVNPHGIALGFDKGPIFERTIKEEKIQLNPGDRIVMYTDGVPEAMSPDQKEFGDDKFHRMVHEHGGKTSNQFINIVVESLEAWRAGSAQSDDITITTVKLL